METDELNDSMRSSPLLLRSNQSGQTGSTGTALPPSALTVPVGVAPTPSNASSASLNGQSSPSGPKPDTPAPAQSNSAQRPPPGSSAEGTAAARMTIRHLSGQMSRGGLQAQIQLLAVVGVLLRHMKYTQIETRMETLRWLLWLHQQLPKRVSVSWVYIGLE